MGGAVAGGVGEQAEKMGGARLRNARASITSRCICSDGKRDRTRQRRVRGRGPIDVELPESEIIVAYTEREHVVRRARRRKLCTVELGGQEAAQTRTDVEALLGAGLARKHALTVDAPHLPPRASGS